MAVADKEPVARVLVIEDEPEIAQILKTALRREGFEVRHGETAARANDLIRSWHPELILLDLNLPDADGRDLARQIRASSDVPLVIVSARSDEIDRITGLELGADDYIVKPFSVPELSSRIRALMRRSHRPAASESRRLTHGRIAMDLDERRTTLEDSELDLSNKEFEMLRILLERPGKVIRREEIASAVWGLSAKEAGKTIDVHISWLRSKLGDDPRRPRFIETIRGVGFRLLKDESEA